MRNSIYFFIIISVFACNTNGNTDWEIDLPELSSSSSPQTVDLNNDGVLDIVVGAGGQEWAESKTGILAVNGANGKILWRAPSYNQIIGSAVFLDINLDKIPDVIIGGRTGELYALSGKNGAIIWQFYAQKGKFSARKDGVYNFFNAQLIVDQDNDKLKDILICNGGDAMIMAGMKHRPPGKLMLISSKTGKVLAEDYMPDLRETYFSPLCMDDSENPQIIFGSGGESQSGHLYSCKLSNLKEGNLKKAAVVLDSTTGKGYLAPPILADISKDGILDIIVNTAEGKTKLFNGKTNEIIWSIGRDSTEVYSQAAVGYFTGNDDVMDVFVNYAKGAYPFYYSTFQYLINGKTGKIAKQYNGKGFTYASPLVADLDNNGTDEVVLIQNKNNMIANKAKPYYQLEVFDFAKNKQYQIGSQVNGACFASTPWLGDLDKDGKLDIVFSGSPAIISDYPGYTTYEKPVVSLQIRREKLQDYLSKSVKWGNYMGKDEKSRIN
jgi:outer membrane protein assembly factor BamB